MTIFGHQRIKKLNALGIKLILNCGRMVQVWQLWVRFIRQRLILLTHKYGARLIPLRQECTMLGGLFITNGDF